MSAIFEAPHPSWPTTTLRYGWEPSAGHFAEVVRDGRAVFYGFAHASPRRAARDVVGWMLDFGFCDADDVDAATMALTNTDIAKLPARQRELVLVVARFAYVLDDVERWHEIPNWS